jgi:hypothetical protein
MDWKALALNHVTVTGPNVVLCTLNERRRIWRREEIEGMVRADTCRDKDQWKHCL